MIQKKLIFYFNIEISYFIKGFDVKKCMSLCNKMIQMFGVFRRKVIYSFLNLCDLLSKSFECFYNINCICFDILVLPGIFFQADTKSKSALLNSSAKPSHFSVSIHLTRLAVLQIKGIQ